MTHIKKSVFICLLHFAEEPGANQDVIRNWKLHWKTDPRVTNIQHRHHVQVVVYWHRTLKHRRIDVQGHSLMIVTY